MLAPSTFQHAPPVYVPRDPTRTALYALIAEQRATFASIADGLGGVPSFVLDAFERYLRCGVPAYGFARFHCDACHHDQIVPLSCKARGLCPSCGGRRMEALTQHLMDNVLPYVPVRQWVLTLPYPLRYRLAYDHELCTAVHRIFARAVRRHLLRFARADDHDCVDAGSVTFVQRYGSGLNLNVHFHLLSMDGFFLERDDKLTFVPTWTPSQQDVERLLLDIHARVLRLVRNRGLLEQASEEDPLASESPTLAACYEGAVTQRVGLGPGRGRPVMKLGVSLSECLASAPARVERGGALCANVDGFDLHGRVAVRAYERERLEELVRYCARPALANDRLTRRDDGRYLLRLKTPFRDGTTHLLFEPLELMERLAAQIPKPRVNLVLYAGILAPHAKRRARGVAYARPVPSSAKCEPSEPPTADQRLAAPQTTSERNSWAEMMRSTFGIDVLACPRCGGRLRLIATILDPRVAASILKHLGRPARAAPQASPRRPPPFWFRDAAGHDA